MSWFTPPSAPVTPACVMQAAQQELVPIGALVAIMAVENGKVGEEVTNTDTSRDIGPMQINSRWLALLAEHGVSEEQIRTNGCVNVIAGAWILRQSYVLNGGDIWKAIGNYHSNDPTRALDYERRVYRVMVSGLTLSEIVAKAND